MASSQNSLPLITIAFMGDIVGAPGRAAAAHAIPILRRDHYADIIIFNAENARHGRGLHPEGYNELINTPAGGPDALTLGDHALDDHRVKDILTQPNAILSRPANHTGFDDSHPNYIQAPISKRSPNYGKLPAAMGGVFVVTVLGRVFMPHDHPDPFQALDDTIASITAKHPNALIITEIHCEATSEKAAIAHHCAANHPRTVIAVVGTHTHVQTNDPTLIPHAKRSPDDPTEQPTRLAFLTDLGMTGSQSGILGFNTEHCIHKVRYQQGKLDIAQGNPQSHGALITINPNTRSAIKIKPIQIKADDNT